MSNEKLKAQLDKLKATMQTWYKELDEYKKWALENDGVIDKTEQAEIDRRTNDITIISMHIAKIERAKGIAGEVQAPKHLAEKVDSIKKELAELKSLLEKQ